MNEIKREFEFIPLKEKSKRTLNKISRSFASVGIFASSKSYMEGRISIYINFVV